MKKVILLLLLILFVSGSAHAATVGLEFSGGRALLNLTQGDALIGYAFTPTQDISLVSLGVYDHGGDGLAESHDVGIWSNLGTPELLAQTTVAAGTSGTLVNNFRYSQILPIVLDAGTTYYLGATDITDNVDRWVIINNSNPGTVTTAPEIFYEGPTLYDIVDGTYAGLSDELFPNVFYNGTKGYFGASMQFQAVPIPGAFWLLGSGLCGMAVLRKKK